MRCDPRGHVQLEPAAQDAAEGQKRARFTEMVPVMVRPGGRAVLREAAERDGVSVGEFLRRAAARRIDELNAEAAALAADAAVEVLSPAEFWRTAVGRAHGVRILPRPDGAKES